MTKLKDRLPHLSPRGRLAAGAALLLALGAAGGAGAVSLTRPTVEMAPIIPTAIAKLPASDGVVTVKGRVAEVYGNRFVIQDSSGRTMVDAGRHAPTSIGNGQSVTVQGRFDDGQLHASYLVGQDGRIDAVGPGGRPPHGPRGAGPRGEDGPPPPPPPGGPQLAGVGAPPPAPSSPSPLGGADAPPPPAAGCAPNGPQVAPPTPRGAKPPVNAAPTSRS